MTEYVEIHAGGTGQYWTRSSLTEASLKKIRAAVEKLLKEQKVPLGLERGFKCEKDPITGKPDRLKQLVGIAGPFTIYWRSASQRELEEFDYDTWLILEFTLIEV